MTTTRNFAINTRCGQIDHTTNILQHHLKQVNPTEIYLCGLFPQEILEDIDIWVLGLEHCDIFKDVIENMNTISSPTIFAIFQ